MQRDPREQEANKLVDQFLNELMGCPSWEEKRQKVWEFISGIKIAARRLGADEEYEKWLRSGKD